MAYFKTICAQYRPLEEENELSDHTHQRSIEERSVAMDSPDYRSQRLNHCLQPAVQLKQMQQLADLLESTQDLIVRPAEVRHKRVR